VARVPLRTKITISVRREDYQDIHVYLLRITIRAMLCIRAAAAQYIKAWNLPYLSSCGSHGHGRPPTRADRFANENNILQIWKNWHVFYVKWRGGRLLLPSSGSNIIPPLLIFPSQQEALQAATLSVLNLPVVGFDGPAALRDAAKNVTPHYSRQCICDNGNQSVRFSGAPVSARHCSCSTELDISAQSGGVFWPDCPLIWLSPNPAASTEMKLVVSSRS